MKRNEKVKDEETRTLNEKIRATKHEEITSSSTQTDTEQKWSQLKETLNNTAEEILGTMEPKKQVEWFDDECKKIIDVRNEARKILIERNTRSNKEKYRQARKEAKKMCRAKKRQYLENKVKNIEESNKEGSTRRFYKEVNQIKKGFSAKINMIKDENGEIVAEEKKILEIWTKYFKSYIKQRMMTHR